MKPLVVITRSIIGPAPKLLRKHFSVRINQTNRVLSPGKIKQFVRGASAILSVIPDHITGEVMDAAGPDLKVIANYAIGYDNIDSDAAKTRQIIVTNTSGILTEAVAEHTFALMLACARQIVPADTFTRKGHYRQWEPGAFLGPQLWGKTLGLIGVGRIGQWVSQIGFGGFGMKIIYTDLERNDEFEMRYHAQYHALPTLLKLADIISLHVPLNQTTHHLLSTDEFRLMKNTAILINTARGPVIDERALVYALRTKQIAAAGLDVFEDEPKISAGLQRLTNVVLSPHIASATTEARAMMSQIAAENIVAVLTGKEPLNPVN